MNNAEIAAKVGLAEGTVEHWAVKLRVGKKKGIIKDKNGVTREVWLTHWTELQLSKLQKLLQKSQKGFYSKLPKPKEKYNPHIWNTTFR